MCHYEALRCFGYTSSTDTDVSHTVFKVHAWKSVANTKHVTDAFIIGSIVSFYKE